MGRGHRLRELAFDGVDAGAREVVLDLSEVTSSGSSGTTALARIRTPGLERAVPISLVAGRTVAHVLRATAMDTLLPLRGHAEALLPETG